MTAAEALPGSLGRLVSQEIAGDERVLAGGGVGQAEDQGRDASYAVTSWLAGQYEADDAAQR